MEAILHSVVLRQEQMVMQWDAEFEQQKQLFHMNTSALIDMLPVRPRKKRLKVEQVPSQDKENLVAFQGFVLTGACVTSPKTKAPSLRGLAKRDLNTRFCDSNGAKAVEVEPPRQVSAALPDAENAEPKGRAARAVRRGNQVSLGAAVKVVVDEDEMPSSLGEDRKRVREELQEENVVLRSCIQESKELSSNPEEGRTGPDGMVAEDAAEKKNKPKRARVIGKAKKDAAEVENLVQTSGDTHVARPCEPEIAVLEVEPEEQPCRDPQAVETEIPAEVPAEPEILSKQPARRGRAKGAAAKADAPDNVVKEPARRGRAKKAPAASEVAVPEITQRVTRSRARKVESVVEAETGPCEPMAAGVAASKESVQIKEEVAADVSPKVEFFSSRGGDLEPKDGDTATGRDAEVEGRSANPMVEGTESLCEPQVCAPAQVAVIRDEPSIKAAGESKVRKPAARSRRKCAKSSSVAFDIGEQRSLPDPRLERIEEAVGQPDTDSAARSRKKYPKSSSVASVIEEPGSLPDSRLERIEEVVGQPDADSASAEHRLGSLCKGPKVEEESAHSAGCEAPPAKEDLSRSAAPERDALVEVLEDRTKEVSRNQVAKIAGGRRASNRRGLRLSRAQRVSHSEAALLPRAEYAAPKSESVPAITQASYTTLLSEMIQGSIPPPETVGALAACSGAVVVARPSKSSLRSGESASAATVFELTAASRDGSASQSEVPLIAGTINRKSTVGDGNVDGKDGSGEEMVEGSTALASEGQRVECEDVSEECSIEANIHFAERSWHAKGDSVQDAVVNAASEVSRVKEAENVMQSRDGASGMNGGTREQVKSDAISPVRYSEARAIEEAMRCSLEQEFHPEVTLTLNRWQFRRRLSPRSKARARRWRSDVAINGVEYGRGQSSEAPAASPSRAVSSRDRSMEGAAYETFLEAQSPVPEAALRLSLGTEKAVDEADTTSWQKHAPEPEEMTTRSIASLCNEVLSQAVHDGEMGDNSVEYEVMGAADEAGNLSPLLRSIYKLSKACEKDMVAVDGILEEDEQQQVHCLIESAKKIVEHVSSKRAQASGAPPGTPGCDQPGFNSSRFYDHTNLYPDRFRLFISPRASGAAPASASSYPVSRTPVVASLVAGDMESTSPQTKRLRQGTMAEAEAASRSADRDSTSSESAGGGDDVVSREFGEGEGVRDCYDAVLSGCDGLRRVDGLRVHVGSDVHLGATELAIDSARVPRGSHDECALQPCEGSMLRIEKQIRAADIAELGMHESEVALSSGTVTETEKLSQLKSRFHALSKDYMVGTSSVAMDAPNLIDAELKSPIKHSSRPSVIPSLRFSSGYASEKRNHARESPQSSKRIDVDAVEDGEPGVYVEGKTGILCSPISIVNQRGPGKANRALVAEESSLSHHGVEMTGAIEEEVVVLEGIAESSEEAGSRSQSMASASAASMLRVEPQCPSNLVGAAFGPVSSSSNLARSNIVANIRSFVPLVQQHQPAAPYPNGKRDVKVKALEAAEAAKRLAELKDLEKQERKKAAEIAKREKQERAAQEKLAKREKAAHDKLMKQQEARAEKENEEASKRRAAGGGATKSVMVDSTNSQGTSSQNVLLKVKKTYELKQKMDQEKQERLLEEQRRKEEEWKKKEAENAARKRKHEAAEKKEREEKRRRQEEAVKAQREMEERQRLELEKKAQKQKAMEEMEKERKAIEEELKRMKRVDKEREVEQRRKKEQEKEVAWLDQKEVTRKQREEAAKQMKLLEIEGRQQAGKMHRSSADPAMPSTGAYHSSMATFHAAMGIAEGNGGGLLYGVNNLVDPQRVSSQILVEHLLRATQQSGEGVGAACRNSQAALRVPRTTPESGRDVSSIVGGAGKPLVRLTPEALGNLAVACGAGASGGPRVLREAGNVPQVQSGSRAGAPVVAGGSKPCQPGQAGFTGPPGGVIGQGDKGVQTYEISPFRDSEDEDSDEEEKRSLKPIPQWARKENMWPQLVRQLQQDPDDIFVGANSCSLDEVFEVKGSKKRPCFKRRGSSGDWVKDCLTWQEQIQYKVAMGYLH